jgi:hypothetical protein
MFSGFLFGQFSSKRQLLIYSKDNDELKQQQLNLLEQAGSGIKERAIQITVVGRESSLYTKYKLDKLQFAVILIGKDGYEKFRSNKPVSVEQLFSIIDAMPMRRSEMNKRNE